VRAFPPLVLALLMLVHVLRMHMLLVSPAALPRTATSSFGVPELG
jgi:hypothetical protein